MCASAIKVHYWYIQSCYDLKRWPFDLKIWLVHLCPQVSSSSSSMRGRGGRSVRSPHGPILGTVEGVSSGQTTVWTNLVQPGDGRMAPWSAPVWERCNSISDFACHAQNRFGRYIIWHTRNVGEQWETVPENNWPDTLQTRSGVPNRFIT